MLTTESATWTICSGTFAKQIFRSGAFTMEVGRKLLQQMQIHQGQVDVRTDWCCWKCILVLRKSITQLSIFLYGQTRHIWFSSPGICGAAHTCFTSLTHVNSFSLRWKWVTGHRGSLECPLSEGQIVSWWTKIKFYQFCLFLTFLQCFPRSQGNIATYLLGISVRLFLCNAFPSPFPRGYYLGKIKKSDFTLITKAPQQLV